MDMNQLLAMGAKAFMESKGSGDAGSNLDQGQLLSALSSLGGSGGFDIGSIVNGMQSGGLGNLVQSWLGDGENAQISSDQVSQVLGSDKVSEFASKLGLSEQEALGGLKEAMPKMIDHASSGGSLLDSIGGISGALNMASKLFG